MTTKDMDLECYEYNLKASDKISMLSNIYQKITQKKTQDDYKY